MGNLLESFLSNKVFASYSHQYYVSTFGKNELGSIERKNGPRPKQSTNR
jgi:hypothetical protein